MSHVDEGALHAYLDGALDAAYGEEEAARIREHVASCADCTARLAEEKGLRSSAASILAGAQPALTDLPSLEEMRAQAERRRGRGDGGTGGTGADGADGPIAGPLSVGEATTGEARSGDAGRRMRTLAWAASVVMALGTGWMVGRMPDTTLADRTEGAVTVPTRAEVDATEAGAGAERLSTAQFQDAVAAPDPANPVQGLGEGVSGAAAATPPTADTEAVDEAPVEVGASRAVDPRLKADADLAEARIQEAEVQRRAEEARAVPAERPEASPAPAAQESPRNRQAARTRRDTEGDALSASAPVEMEPLQVLISPDGAGTSVAVPDLDILTVEVVQIREAEGVLRVLQALPGGEILEVLQLPAGVDPSVLAPLPEGVSQWVAPRGDGWWVLRASIDPDSLALLGGRLPGGG